MFKLLISFAFALQLLNHANGQLIVDGLTQQVKQQFANGFDSIPSLAALDEREDEEFNRQLMAELKAEELRALESTVNEITYNILTQAALKVQATDSVEKKLAVADEVLASVNAGNFVSEFKAKHLLPEQSSKRVATRLTKASTSHAKSLRAALLAADRDVNAALIDILMPVAADSSRREKRQAVATGMAWACRLMRLSAIVGTSNATNQRVAEFILARVPERFRNQFTHRLAHGGAKGLTRLAAALCGVLSPTFTGSDEQPKKLMALYELAFAEVDFDRFKNFVDFYKAAVGAGLGAAHDELVVLKTQVKKVLIEEMLESN